MKEHVFLENLWINGVEKSLHSEYRKDTEYSVIKEKKLLLLNDKDLINHPLWVEAMEKALSGKVPSLAFEYWMEQGWLSHALPEISNLWGRDQPEIYHPEIDTGIHAMMVIDRSAYNNNTINARWGALCHDFGKSITDIDKLPSHINHEIKGVPLVQKRVKHWGFSPNRIHFLLKVTEHHGTMHNLHELKPLTMINFINKLELRNDIMLNDFCDVVTADDQGRKNFFNNQPRNIQLLKDVVAFLKENNFEDYLEIDTHFWNEKVALMKTLPDCSEDWFSDDAKQKFFEKRKQLNTYNEIKQLVVKNLADTHENSILSIKNKKVKL